MLQFHKNSPEMEKCIIYKKTSNNLNPETWISLKISSCTYSIHQPLLQNHLQKENISMKKNIPPSNSLSAMRSLIPGPPGSSVYRTLKEISSSVQHSLYGNSVFRAFKKKNLMCLGSPQSVSSELVKEKYSCTALPPQLPL